MLRLPENWARLLRSQSIVVAKIAENLSRFFRSSHESIQANHALENLFPHFGRCPNVGDAPHHAAGIALMTAGTFRDDERIVNGDPLFCLDGGLSRTNTCRQEQQ